MPNPVGGKFDQVGVDVVQLPTSHEDNKYAIVFVDRLTKWPEVFPASDQSSLTIAKPLVSVHIEFLQSFCLTRGLSKLMYEVYTY